MVFVCACKSRSSYRSVGCGWVLAAVVARHLAVLVDGSLKRESERECAKGTSTTNQQHSLPATRKNKHNKQTSGE